MLARGIIFFCLLVLVEVSSGSGTRFVLMQTTDIHGWVAGHPHNETLNTDFGDYCSLIQHMHQRAEEEDFVFLLFDSGDLIEGTGLSDATPIHGQYIFPVMENIKNYTALAIGNHDIGHSTTVQLMRDGFIPHYNSDPNQNAGKYLTANSFMKGPQEEFIGEPYSIYHTRFGQKILLLGWLYNFTQEAAITNVQTVEASLFQPWFTEAMQEPDLDMIIVTAHVDPTTPPEIDQIYQGIRLFHPTLPFIIFSGHRHILYFEQYDANSFTLESGKYFEVLGVVEFDLVGQDFENFEYEWYDTSLDNFYLLSGTNESNFLTEEGKETKKQIGYYTNTLHLNDTVGCSPQFYNPESLIIDQNSLYNLYIEDVVPTVVFNYSLPNTQFFISNTATLRYPLFQGRVTVNDIFTVIPFSDEYVFFQNLSGSQVRGVLSELRSFLSPNLQMTYYFETYGEYDIHRPAYTHSIMAIEADQTYDIVCAEYDAETIGPIIAKLYPSTDSLAEHYPTVYSSSSALSNYVYTQFPCSESCEC